MANRDETIDLLRSQGRRALIAGAPADLSPREALTLLSHALGCSESYLLAHGDVSVSAEQAELYRSWVTRRASGEPFAYITGVREFFGRRFCVDRTVLIPRPETEHLVEQALGRAPRHGRVLDLGTGSGNIALSLALERPDLHVIGSDRSLGALNIARRNWRQLGAPHNARFTAADLLAGFVGQQFQLIVSNPPYVPETMAVQLSPTVRDFEPPNALFAGSDGLAFYERLLGTPTLLSNGQEILLEIGAGQSADILRLADPTLEHTLSAKDFAGIDRVMGFRRPPAR